MKTHNYLCSAEMDDDFATKQKACEELLEINEGRTL